MALMTTSSIVKHQSTKHLHLQSCCKRFFVYYNETRQVIMIGNIQVVYSEDEEFFSHK